MRKTFDPFVPLTLICRNYSTKTYRVLTCFRLSVIQYWKLWKILAWVKENPAC